MYMKEDVKLDQVQDMETNIWEKTRRALFVQPRKGQKYLWSLSIRWIRERDTMENHFSSNKKLSWGKL